LARRTAIFYVEEMDGEKVCVRRHQESSERAINLLNAMILVGDHPNIFKFIGIFYDEGPLNTGYFKNMYFKNTQTVYLTSLWARFFNYYDVGIGNLNIVTEYFENGSLQAYFRNMQTQFQDYNDIKPVNETNLHSDPIFPKLCKFASGIARGMEFISSKQVGQSPCIIKILKTCLH